jgi:quinol monooxygenase YgiN
VRKQLAAAGGLIGYTLRARPLARDYWTLSVWTDRIALREFMRTPPHVQVMTSLKPYMGPTKVRHLDDLRSRWPSQHGWRP